MPTINEINGNLITLALEGNFDVIGHGCNCFCTMKRGIAPQMAKAFNCHLYYLEHGLYKGDINKLGQIQFADWRTTNGKNVTVVNMYTQYHWSEPDPVSGVPLNYNALDLCLQKLNHIFKGKHIGLNKIGCGYAHGEWSLVKTMIERDLKDCTVTIVNYVP